MIMPNIEKMSQLPLNHHVPLNHDVRISHFVTVMYMCMIARKIDIIVGAYNDKCVGYRSRNNTSKCPDVPLASLRTMSMMQHEVVTAEPRQN